MLLETLAVQVHATGRQHERGPPGRQTRGTLQVAGRACSVDSSSPAASTGTRWPTSRRVSAGVATMADSVDTVVMATLSGTSARARYVTTLLATPPGQQATRQMLRAACAGPGC